jgi:hypothetical protein
MFDRRAVLATRTPNEEIVAAGTGEVAKLLGAGEAKVAVRATRAKPRYAQAMIERPRFLPFLRPFRYASAASQAAAEPLPQHRFFLFRERY